MKQIQPISIWGQGSSKQAVTLNAYAVNVQLGHSASFYYSLHDENEEKLAEGNLTMQGEDYQTWDDDSIAWEWIANNLNLTIIETP